MIRSIPEFLVLVSLSGMTASCGSNTPEIPPELLETSEQASGDYPEGPYGSEVGDTIESFSFPGWLDPQAAGFDAEQFEPIAFADFYNPDDPEGNELLLINTTAVWCASCRVEHADLPERFETFGPRGLVIFALMYQDGTGDPATENDLEVWTRQFDTDFPMALDDDFLMGRFVAPDVAPLNLLVDARTMTVIDRFIGDQQAVIWPTIDNELTDRGR